MCVVISVFWVLIHAVPSFWFLGYQKSMHTLQSYTAARVRLLFGILSTPHNLPWLTRSGIYRAQLVQNDLISSLMTGMYLKCLADHVPAVTSETVEWCVPAVLRLAWCKTFSHCVDPSKPARFFIVSSFSMLRANSVSNFLLWASFFNKFLVSANLIFVSSFSLLWANFCCFEQFF